MHRVLHAFLGWGTRWPWSGVGGPAWLTSLSGVRPRAQACRSVWPPVPAGPPQTALHSGVSGLLADVSGAQSPACTWEGATPKPARPCPLHPHRELPVNQTPVWVLPFLQWGQPGGGRREDRAPGSSLLCLAVCPAPSPAQSLGRDLLWKQAHCRHGQRQGRVSQALSLGVPVRTGRRG